MRRVNAYIPQGRPAVLILTGHRPFTVMLGPDPSIGRRAKDEIIEKNQLPM
jgi:hypothetical protein